jgi:hypothetical protein
MRTAIVASVVALVMAACGGPQQVTATNLPVVGAPRIHRFHTDGLFSYVVDTAVEACFLLYGGAAGAAMEPVDCGKLARSVPEVDKVISWVTTAAAEGAAAAEPAALP